MSELAALAAEPSSLEVYSDPGEFVILACERAKTWLVQALEQGDIAAIVETKTQAEVIRVYTAQKQLGKDAELSATEIVRRAEQGLGVAIRRAQEAGTVRRAGDSTGPLSSYERNGKTVLVEAVTTDNKFSPKEFLQPGQATVDTYAMTDGVTAEEFDSAIATAKAEGNLSRANVVRKVKAIKTGVDTTADAVAERRQQIRDLAMQRMSSRQIGAALGVGDETVRRIAREMGVDIPADAVMLRTKRLDSSRVVSATAETLDGLVAGLYLANLADLDPAEAADWSDSIAVSIRALSKWNKQLKETHS